MKRFLKNKYVMLAIIIVVLSIVYFGVNKAIKQYNFTNNNEIVTEEKGEEYLNKEMKLEMEENLDENDGSSDEEEEDGNENSENGKEVDNNEGDENDTNSENKIYVYITGEVNVPGVIILNEDSRIIDAINAAGGTTSKANVSKVNLAYVLKDGMKVNIPNDSDLKNNPDFEYITMGSGDGKNDSSSGAASTNSSSSSLSASNSSKTEKPQDSGSRYSIVNINTATQTELETLPGIGPSLALKIINYRNENGKFSSIEEIKNVSGIGENKFNEMKNYITV